MEDKPKFYTAFVLFMADLRLKKVFQLHCTHKWLGVIEPTDFQKVAGICDEYFKIPKTFPLAIFNKPDEFITSAGNKVRVLKSFIHTDRFFLDLRAQLDVFKKDEYPIYQPHITIKGFSDTALNGSFYCYAIMSGEKILKYWGNEKCPRDKSSNRPTDLARLK